MSEEEPLIFFSTQQIVEVALNRREELKKVSQYEKSMVRKQISMEVCGEICCELEALGKFKESLEIQKTVESMLR